MATPAQDDPLARGAGQVPFRPKAKGGDGRRPGIPSDAVTSLLRHWPEYSIEAALLGLFMVSACVFTALFEYPASPVHRALPSPLVRRALGGVAMGLTAAALIYSPWGKRSGAHFNPAITLTFYHLKRIERWDAVFYVVAQFLGGAAGMFATVAVLGDFVRDPRVHYVVTIPGRAGVVVAFVAEFAISLGLLLTLLTVMHTKRFARFTGWIAGMLVAFYITVEGPLSGMSMNPARTFASAFPAKVWTAWWVYFTAPVLGMFLAAGVYQRLSGRRVMCAKLHHQNNKRCIFRCGYRAAESSNQVA